MCPPGAACDSFWDKYGNLQFNEDCFFRYCREDRNKTHCCSEQKKKTTTTYKQTPEPRATQGTLLPRYCRVNTVHMKSLFKQNEQILMSRLQKLQFNHERYLKLYFAILVLFKFHGRSIQTNMLMSTALFIF